MKLAKLVLIVLLLLLTACGTRMIPAPTVTPAPTDVFCPPPLNWITYITQSGDSLASLAKRTSTTVQALELANCLNNPHGILMSGQVFYLPRKPVAP